MSKPVYLDNVNLHIPDTLHQTLTSFTVGNLLISIFTLWFQRSNPHAEKNMGRLFFIILAFQTLDRLNYLVQLLFVGDLSLPYYQIDNNLLPLAVETWVCKYCGALKCFCDFMAQIYAFWVAFIIQQILKDPIHKVNAQVICYHVTTIFFSLILMGVLFWREKFGVEETLQCGIFHTTSFKDDIIIALPMVLLPFQLLLLLNIVRKTPFLVKAQLKFFIYKYTVYLIFLMGTHILELIIIVFGSLDPAYYDYDTVDGFKYIRYAYLLTEQMAFLALCAATLIEPVFVDWAQKQIKRYKRILFLKRDEVTSPTHFGETYNGLVPAYDDSSDDEEEPAQENSLERPGSLRSQNAPSQTQFTLQRTRELAGQQNFFLINSILTSIYYCLQQSQQSEGKAVTARAMSLFKNMLQRERDREHVIDMLKFYEDNREVCIGDVTNGVPLKLTISEYGAHHFRELRESSDLSGFDWLASFAPSLNFEEMAKFQEGSGKSESFFFFTSDNRFVIKTVKPLELRRLVKKNLIEYYCDHLKRNPQSLLGRMYGVYKIKVKFMQPLTVLVMNNVMGTETQDITATYDLKGSKFQRHVIPTKPTSVLKDNNFLERGFDRMRVEPKVRSRILERLERDVEFLVQNQLMDYSLLLVIYKKNRADSDARRMTVQVKRGDPESLELQDLSQSKEDALLSQRQRQSFLESDQDVRPEENLLQEHSTEKEKAPQGRRHFYSDPMSLFGLIRKKDKQSYIQYESSEEKEVYYRMAIIDYLQKYGKRKRLEYRTLKIMHSNVPANEFSCQPTKEYGDRFYRFLGNNLFQ